MHQVGKKREKMQVLKLGCVAAPNCREAGGEERLAGRVESPQWSLIVHTLVSESEIIQGPTQVITS